MKKINLLTIAAVVALFTGCASYQANSLSALDPGYVRNYSEIQGMEIGCKAYSVDDCFTYLDRNVIAKGYQPIQLTFRNNLDKHYSFSTRDVNLPCANSELVARTVHTSTVGRVAGYSVGGLFLWPLFIPAFVDGIKSSNANRALDADFDQKARGNVLIGPHSYSRTLIFVPKAHYSPVFDISLLDEESGKHQVISLSVGK
ncbi:MAG: hypothetical protein P0S93_04820 [Candidatus Neptunochlamydia sp.]|nr:hypothetical protein [Candidatus Neptunochlamydia sp.]